MTWITPTTRYWLPRGAVPTLEEHGWLAEPGADAHTAPSRDAPFQSRCAVLLGPAGIGKSTVLGSRTAFCPSPGVPVVRSNLAQLGRDSIESFLTRVTDVRRWLDGDGELCLLLDSLDEPLQRLVGVAQELEGLLATWPVDRLWLRLVCRSGDWPPFLDAALDTAFRGRCTSWQLLPLTLGEIRRSAARAHVDPDAFISAVLDRRVGPLAAVPMTLQLLLSTVTPSIGLPGGVWELYEHGLLALCEEHDERRRLHRRDPEALPARRLVPLAARTAACTRFGGFDVLWTGPEASAPPGALAEGRLLHALDDGTAAIPVRRADVRQLLASPLLSLRGRSTAAWTHATVEEHLAAVWLRTLADDQVRQLLLAPDGQLVPQTARLAAWLVSADPSRFAWLIAADPAPFVGQLDIPDAGVRASALEALFSSVAAGEEVRRWDGDYGNLDHPDLPEQLARHLGGSSPEARRLAVDIARRRRVPGLGDALSRIALDPQEPTPLRVAATLAIGDRVDAHGVEQLLDQPTPQDDPYGELLGAALLASWPRHLTTREVLRRLKAARTPVHVLGNLALAASEVARALTAQDLRDAAEFLTALDTVDDDSFIDELTQATFHLCVDHLDDERASAACVRVALLRLRERGHVLRPSFDGSFPVPAERRRFALLIACAAEQTDPVEMLVGPARMGGLLRPDDLTWLQEQRQHLDQRHRPMMDRLCVALGEGRPAATAIPPPRPALSRTLNEDNTAVLEEALERSEGGDDRAFVDVSWLVSGRDVDGSGLGPLQPDLSARPRWRLLTLRQRLHVLDAATRFAQAPGRHPSGGWASPASGVRLDEGVRALVTLRHQLPDALDTLAAEAWRTWAVPLVRWPVGPAGPDREDKADLISRALPHARGVMEDALIAAVDAAGAVGDAVTIDVEAALLWSDDLADRFEQRLRTPLPAPTAASTARVLLRHDAPRARPLLVSWCHDASDPARAAAAAVLLIHHDGRTSGPVITELIAARPDVLRDAIRQLGPVGPDPAPELAPAVAADLAIWLLSEAAAVTGPTVPRAWRSDDTFREWAGHLLSALRSEASAASVTALERVVAAMPDVPGIRDELLLTRTAHRRRAWAPVAPELLMQLPRRRGSLIRTVDDLRVAVVAAMAAVQERLRGEAPEARLLWDTHARRPKGEEEVSDFLLHRLRDLLGAERTVVNREVQVVRSSVGGVGTRTDLRIDATVDLPSGGSEVVTVVVEVKGAWNPDLASGLGQQLVGQYLEALPGAHGVYVVLWPDLHGWRPQGRDRRREAVARLDREATMLELHRQAQAVTTRGWVVKVVDMDL